MRRIAGFVGLLAVMSIACVTASEEHKPAPRIYHSLLSMPDGQILVAGGIASFGFDAPMLPRMWTFDSETRIWSAAGDLKAGYFIGAAYDRQSDRMIVLTLSGETWAFDPTTGHWRNMNPETAPSGRCGHSLGYDDQSDRIVLFGGFACTDVNDPLFDDTWSYDFETNKWTEHKPALAPPARIYAAMTYHVDMDRIVMWGGRVEDARVWSFDVEQNVWQPHAPDRHPEGIRSYVGVAYDAGSQLIHAFGGLALEEQLAFTGELLDETWTYDLASNAWTRLSPEQSPPARSHLSMAAGKSGKLLIYGGVTGAAYSDQIVNNIWAFDPVMETWTQLSD